MVSKPLRGFGAARLAAGGCVSGVRVLVSLFMCICVTQIGRVCASSAIQQTISMSVKEPWGISTSGHRRAPGGASTEAQSHSLVVRG